jgi:hypothetical protein
MESSLRTGPENAAIPSRPCDAAVRQTSRNFLECLVGDRSFCCHEAAVDNSLGLYSTEYTPYLSAVLLGNGTKEEESDENGATDQINGRLLTSKQ